MAGIAVIDAGGQYCHLIARRIRELGVNAEIFSVDIGTEEIREYNGIILSGGPCSIYEPGAPSLSDDILCTGAPILGICYGMQMIVHGFGGAVRPGDKREYGLATLSVSGESKLLYGTSSQQQVWMSHGDTITRIPPSFIVSGSTPDCPFAAIESHDYLMYGIQFHPEVTHTEYGNMILENFIFDICKCQLKKTPRSMTDQIVDNIRATVGSRKVYFLISGGVDSTVAYTLCAKALPPEQLGGIYIDTGFMRKGDSEHLNSVFQELGLPDILCIGAQHFFTDPLEYIVDPEDKRKVIGETFVEIVEDILSALDLAKENWMLGQGTIYPDTIESGGTSGSSVIKTHHNRVRAIQDLKDAGRVLEPLSELYKDEVRDLGRELGLSEKIISRHPFPGPGLAIRTICSPNTYDLLIDSEIDAACTQYGLTGYFLPLRSVGVQGDNRTYGCVAVLSGAADVALLQDVSSEITNTCENINRVLYCLTPGADLSLLSVHPATVTQERLDILREADAIVQDILERDNLLSEVWQFPVILLPVSLNETTGESVVLRPIVSVDGMTAAWACNIPYLSLQEMRERIEQIPEVDCVFLDVGNKPPETIEWE